MTTPSAKQYGMSWWLSAHVRRIVAILLLVLDLGLEPGSALSFVGMADPDEGEAVADLCRQDDFSWGRPRAAIDEATRPVASPVNSDDGVVPSASAVSADIQCAVAPASVEAIYGTTDVLFEIVPSELDLRQFEEHSPHRNTYIAQKRDIVLIV